MGRIVQNVSLALLLVFVIFCVAQLLK